MAWRWKWCPEPESNQRHADFQSAALPAELSGHRVDGVSSIGCGRDTSATRGCPEAFADFLASFCAGPTERGFGKTVSALDRPRRPGQRAELPRRCLHRESRNLRSTISQDPHRHNGGSRMGGRREHFPWHKSGRSFEQPLGKHIQRDPVATAGQLKQAK